MEGYRRQGHISITRFHEVSRRPSYEDARHVARIVFDQQSPVRAPDIGAERCRPVAQAEQMNAGRSQGSLLLRQEGQPEAEPILWQSKRDIALVLLPDRNRRAAQGTVDRLMVGTDGIQGDVALEFSQSVSGKAIPRSGGSGDLGFISFGIWS